MQYNLIKSGDPSGRLFCKYIPFGKKNNYDKKIVAGFHGEKREYP